MTEKIKLISYNIHRALSIYRKRNISQRIGEFFHREQPDIICLQEVWGEPEREPAILNALTKKFWKKKAYGKNAVFVKGHQGNAVICRYEIISWENINISYPPKEGRGFLVVQGKTTNQNILFWIICIHLGLNKKERRFQFQALTHYLKEKIPPSEPLILAGDFNDWRGRMTQDFALDNDLEDCLSKGKTKKGKSYPALFPLFTLDRIFFRNCKLKGGRIIRMNKRAILSDHLPIEGIFELEKMP